MVMKVSPAGIRSAYIIMEDADGFIAGKDGLVAAGEYDEADFFTLIESINLATPDDVIVNNRGNDKSGFTYIFRSEENPNGTVVASAIDLELWAQSTGNSVHALGNNINGVILNSDYFEPKNYWLVVNREAYSADTATYGNTGFVTDFMRVKVAPKKTNQEFQAPEKMELTITAIPTARMAWGELLDNTGGTNYGNATKGNGSLYNYNPYQLTIGVFKGDGSTTSFSIPSSVVDAENTDAFVVTAAGAFSELTYNSGTPSTGEYKIVGTTVTLGSTYATGDRLFLVRRI